MGCAYEVACRGDRLGRRAEGFRMEAGEAFGRVGLYVC